MKYKILLTSINDGTVYTASYSSVEHLGLAYLGASLRKAGYEVKIIDGFAMNLTMDEIIKETFSFNPDLIGITAEYNTFPFADEYCNKIKNIDNKIKICLGGEHATFSSKEILKNNTKFDFIVRGEGENTIVETANQLSRGEILNNIKGVYFKDANGNIIRNQDREAFKDLDKFPFPERDVFEYCLKKGLKPAISILTSRGCHSNCSFCNASKFFNIGGGKAWRARSPKNVVDELKMLLKKYNSDDIYPIIYFQDENFVGPGKYGVERAKEIALEIIDSDLKINFEIFCRTDSFNGEEETLKLLKQAGLSSALLGLESGNESGLQTIKKNTTVKQNLTTLELFRKYNIVTSSSGFLMFDPYSTLSELKENANFLLKIGQASIYNMSLKVMMYPGIRIVDDMRKKGIVEPDHCHYKADKYRFLHPEVSEVAEIINSIDLELIKQEDSTLRHMDFTLAKIKEQIREKGNYKSNEKLQKLENQLLHAKLDLHKTNYKFFFNIVELVDEKRIKDNLNILKNNFLQNHHEKFEELVVTFYKYLENIDTILNETSMI